LTFLRKLSGLTSLIVVCTYFLVLALIVVLLVQTSIGADLASNQFHIVLGAFLLLWRTPVEINALAGFIVLFGISVLCIFAAARLKGGFNNSLHQMFSNSERRRLPNWLLVMPLISSALALTVVAITILQGLFGVPTGSIQEPCDPANLVTGCIPPFSYLYQLSYAPPLEEVWFRISILGLLVALRTLWSSNVLRNPFVQATPSPIGRGKLALLSFLVPEYAKSRAGLPTFAKAGWKSIHWTEWIFLIMTSVAFGIAHYVANVGWEAGKVLTAGMAGFTLGLVFLLYGAYASILLHWFFDVYFATFLLSSILLGDALTPVADFVALLVLATGVIGVFAGIRWFRSTLRGSHGTTYIVPSVPSPV